jgi:hypothetical protein
MIFWNVCSTLCADAAQRVLVTQVPPCAHQVLELKDLPGGDICATDCTKTPSLVCAVCLAMLINHCYCKQVTWQQLQMQVPHLLSSSAAQH